MKTAMEIKREYFKKMNVAPDYHDYCFLCGVKTTDIQCCRTIGHVFDICPECEVKLEMLAVANKTDEWESASRELYGDEQTCGLSKAVESNDYSDVFDNIGD